MKKILFVLAGVLFLAIAEAQTDKGDWLVGGRLEFNTSKSNASFRFNPDIGWFFANNLAIGGQFNLAYTKLGANKVTSYGAGPFVRYYFLKKNVKPFLLASGGAETSKINNNTSTTTVNAFNYLVGGGTAFFINPNVALEAVIGYRHTMVQKESGGGGFNFSFGFQVYINRNQAESVRSTLQ